MERSVVNWLLATILLTTDSIAEAQQPTKVYRIGYLSPRPERREEVFRQGLHYLGYVEGKNILIEYRDADDKFDRLPELARDMARLKVDVIVRTGTPMTRAASSRLRRFRSSLWLPAIRSRMA